MLPVVKLITLLFILGKNSVLMSDEDVKNNLVKSLSDYFKKIVIFSLHPKHKINIVTKFVYGKLRCDLTIYHLPEIWIAENVDNKVNGYI